MEIMDLRISFKLQQVDRLTHVMITDWSENFQKFYYLNTLE